MKRITLKIEPGQNKNDLAILFLDRIGHRKSKYIVSCICQMLQTNGILNPEDLEQLSNEQILQLKFNESSSSAASNEITMQLELLREEVRQLSEKYDQVETRKPKDEITAIKEVEPEVSRQTISNLMGNITLD
ncbi:MAG: hypothetical protein E7272_07790 [Pseudobutyrivibrio ruminis]|uniref:Uncharacterized protein n=1 Tax=Pseudobutyrivibrio ruminis TaxID=46206 RepID=A0A927UCT4_9FIRM|nr:hypothetical protein [Pseudobutyrivibrio ruminis]